MKTDVPASAIGDKKWGLHEPGAPQLPYSQIFWRFLRFGFLAWGGPVAQIAMVRRELVEEERWVSSGRFNRLLAVYQVLPGPEAHELCVFLGMLPGGRLARPRHIRKGHSAGAGEAPTASAC
jgi:chromate transporter